MTATSVAVAVLEEDRTVSSSDIRRPPVDPAAAVSEFWTEVGFPTSESRYWEDRSVRNLSGAFDDVSCRSSGSAEVRGPVMAARRSSSPQAVAVGKRVRLGWRGPLPLPRSTPPPCLGDFLPADFGATAESEQRSPAIEVGREETTLRSPGLVVGLDRSRPWAHLGRRLRGLTSNLAKCPRAIAAVRTTSAIDAATPPPTIEAAIGAARSVSPPPSVQDSSLCSPGTPSP